MKLNTVLIGSTQKFKSHNLQNEKRKKSIIFNSVQIGSVTRGFNLKL